MELLSQRPFETTKEMVEYALSIQGEPFSPSITTPTELLIKVPKLNSFLYREWDKYNKL